MTLPCELFNCLQASVADLQGSLAREQAALREAAASRAKLESLLQEQQAAGKAASGEYTE
jgi:hypothetical protein